MMMNMLIIPPLPDFAISAISINTFALLSGTSIFNKTTTASRMHLIVASSNCSESKFKRRNLIQTRLHPTLQRPERFVSNFTRLQNVLIDSVLKMWFNSKGMLNREHLAGNILTIVCLKSVDDGFNRSHVKASRLFSAEFELLEVFTQAIHYLVYLSPSQSLNITAWMLANYNASHSKTDRSMATSPEGSTRQWQWSEWQRQRDGQRDEGVTVFENFWARNHTIWRALSPSYTTAYTVRSI